MSCCSRRRSVVVGAGYIAVEMAGILSTLGSKTSLIIRQTSVRIRNRDTVLSFSKGGQPFALMKVSQFSVQVLRNFDNLISTNCTKELQNSGIDLWKNSQVKSVCKTDKGLEVTIATRDPEKRNDEEKIRTIQEVDCVLWAIGRQPNISGLNIGQLVRVCKVSRKLVMSLNTFRYFMAAFTLQAKLVVSNRTL